MKLLVLINGLYGMGKTTLSNKTMLKLASKGYATILAPNAKEVWKVCREAFNWDEVKDARGRVLSWDVTKAGYHYDYNFWEKKTYEYIKKVDPSNLVDIVLVDDWRIVRTLEYFDSQSLIDGFKVVTVKMNNPSNRVSAVSKDSILVAKDNEFDPIPENFKFDIVIEGANIMEELEYLASTLADKLIGRLD